MVRTQIQLPEEMVRRVRQVADHEQTSMAEVIRRAVSFFFRGLPSGPIASHAYERAAAAAGRFSSGRSDLSRHHDRHFAEASDP